MEDTIYIVTAGVHSEYHIVGVFDSYDLAERCLNSMSQSEYEDSRVEEYPLNPHKESLNHGLFPYYVEMDEEGEVFSCIISYDLLKHFLKNENCSTYIKNMVKIPYGWKNLLISVSWSKDSTTAIKVANQKRTRLIALNQWKGNYKE